MAAALVAEGAVLSHRSAAALWGVRGATGGPGSRSRRRRISGRGRARIHSRRPGGRGDDRTRHPGHHPRPHAPRPRRVVSPHHLERAATEAEIRRLGSPTSLADLVARYPGRRGRPRSGTPRAPRHRPQHHQAGARAPVPRLPRRPRTPPAVRQRQSPRQERSTASGPTSASSSSSTASRPTAPGGLRERPRPRPRAPARRLPRRPHHVAPADREAPALADQLRALLRP